MKQAFGLVLTTLGASTILALVFMPSGPVSTITSRPIGVFVLTLVSLFGMYLLLRSAPSPNSLPTIAVCDYVRALPTAAQYVGEHGPDIEPVTGVVTELLSDNRMTVRCYDPGGAPYDVECLGPVGAVRITADAMTDDGQRWVAGLRRRLLDATTFLDIDVFGIGPDRWEARVFGGLFAAQGATARDAALALVRRLPDALLEPPVQVRTRVQVHPPGRGPEYVPLDLSTV